MEYILIVVALVLAAFVVKSFVDSEKPTPIPPFPSPKPSPYIPPVNTTTNGPCPDAGSFYCKGIDLYKANGACGGSLWCPNAANCGGTIQNCDGTPA